MLCSVPAAAQVSPAFYDYVRPDLEWSTIETEHFLVHYHTDAEGNGGMRSAQVTARIAEEIYGPITELYDLEPDTKTSIVLKDYEDYSNGAAYFFDNKIDIWTPSLVTPLRGEHNWLRNVITHEFTHIVQVQKTMKGARRWPVVYLQWLSYEDVRRPDILYGYPDGIASYPVPVLNNPAWFAEGTAQYQRAGLEYETWDTHRDMLLRTRVLAGEEFSLPEMGSFLTKTSLERESVYNHGFAFSLYLAQTYGEDVLRRLSEALGKWSNYNVERAIREATGVPADQVYAEWMEALRSSYEEQTAAIRAVETPGETLEAGGFNNQYPRFSPDGRRLAYVSNRGQDYNLTSLYIQDLDSGALTEVKLDQGSPVAGARPRAFGHHGFHHVGSAHTHTCAFGHQLVAGVGGAFAWSTDGRTIYYTRRMDTPEGRFYDDLYAQDLDADANPDGKPRRLTMERRASAPAALPDGSGLVFVGEGDGSRNLYRLDFETLEVTALTNFDDGSQVYAPAVHPDGDWIAFGFGYYSGRDLYRIRVDGSGLEPLLATDADERNPSFSPDGQALYFASDQGGLFNIHRMPAGGGPTERLTTVSGGAFMPAVDEQGRLALARYDHDGYRIALIDEPVAQQTPFAYAPPPVLAKDEPAQDGTDWAVLNTFDDRDLRPVPHPTLAEGDAPALPQDADTAGDPTGSPDEPARSYGNVFTSFSFYPVLRYDGYVTRDRRRTIDGEVARRGRVETALRNMKTGVYLGSRDMLDGLSFFGGLLVGPASQPAESLSDFFTPARLIGLERDAFLQVEYKNGFPGFSKRWAPQIGIELYSIRRRVEDGLSIEEFACTACFPTTTFTDVAYSLWEAGVYSRSKLNRSTLFELGYRYSPYSVKTESFFSEEQRATIEGNNTRYFIGHGPSARLYMEQYAPALDGDVVPEGMRIEASYDLQFGQLLDRFDIEDGVLVPEYIDYTPHRLTLDARYGKRLGMLGDGAHGIGLRARGSTILGGEVDQFFDEFIGGLIGMRGYPFYALGGNEAWWLQGSYIFPILPRTNRQLLFLQLDKIYGRVYADAGMAWTGSWPGGDALRTDAGAELRVGLGSFYLFPTAFFVSGTYGFDQFDFQLEEGFVADDGRTSVTYGKEWRWHFGLLFGFDI